jgi:DNA-binding IclR family transcriptional regulator
MSKTSRSTSRQRVQSAEVGGEILKALARQGPAVSLSRLSEALGIAPAKAHRYLQSLMVSGLAAQDLDTGHYRLGPEALAIGLAALGHIDVVGSVSRLLPRLRDETGHTCFLAIWANRGATVVKVIEAVAAVTVVTQIGSVLPLVSSASGQVFAAFLEPNQYQREGIDEWPELERALKRKDAPLARRIAQVRERRLATTEGQVLPGIDAIAAPVFGVDGRLAAVLTVVGPHRGFDSSPDGALASRLRTIAGEASAALGYAAPTPPALPPTDASAARRRARSR